MTDHRDLETSDRFHVIARGADRQDIFTTDAGRLGFESLLCDVSERSCAVVEAYALMSNHVHLVVHAADRKLPDFARLLLSRHAMRYNWHTSRTGPLFDGRYHSVPVVGDRHYVATCRYVHRNPVVITGLAALPAYRWSSLGVLLGRRPCPEWLDVRPLRGLVDPESHLDEVRRSAVDDLGFNGWRPILRPSAADVVRAVREVVGSQSDVVATGRFDPVRSLAITLSVELRVAADDDIATAFGIDRPGVRQAARRGRARAATDQRFDSLRRRTLEVLADRTPIRRDEP